MTSWESFGLLKENLVTYFTGTEMILALVIIAFVLITLLALGLEFKYSVVFVLPLLTAFALGGWFGVATWIANVGLLIVAIIYGYALLKITGS